MIRFWGDLWIREIQTQISEETADNWFHLGLSAIETSFGSEHGRDHKRIA
jgi:hypothetical protein